MRFYFPMPPTGDNTEEQLRDLTSWLYSLTETLNEALNSVSLENLSPSLKKMLEGEQES